MTVMVTVGIVISVVQSALKIMVSVLTLIVTQWISKRGDEMMDAVKFLREWKRMCYTLGCVTCQLNNTPDECHIFAMTFPETVIKIVEEWSKEHPAKTRLSVLLEQYPALKNIERVFDDYCAGEMYGFDCTHGLDMSFDSCKECWNEPV